MRPQLQDYMPLFPTSLPIFQSFSVTFIPCISQTIQGDGGGEIRTPYHTLIISTNSSERFVKLIHAQAEHNSLSIDGNTDDATLAMNLSVAILVMGKYMLNYLETPAHAPLQLGQRGQNTDH